MIHVLHTIDTTGPGGAETIFVNLVTGLDREKFHPVVAIQGGGWVCDQLVDRGIQPIFINSSGSFNIRYLLELIQIIRSNRVDVIQSHLLGSNLYSCLAGMMCGIPVISTFHGFVDIGARERYWGFKSRIINRGASRIVFVSHRLREYCIGRIGFSAAKSRTIYNGIDTSVFRPQPDTTIRRRLGIADDDIVIGAVGNIRPAKGYEYLVRAAKLVVEKHPKARFVVAGDGSGRLFEDLKRLQCSLGLEKQVFFIGFERNVSLFMNNLDIFVLPSVSEGFSISTIEALACGLPLVVTSSGGPEEILETMATGTIVPAADHHALATALLQCIESPAALERSLETPGACHSAFSLQSMVEQYMEQYLDVCHKESHE